MKKTICSNMRKFLKIATFKISVKLNKIKDNHLPPKFRFLFSLHIKNKVLKNYFLKKVAT